MNFSRGYRFRFLYEPGPTGLSEPGMSFTGSEKLIVLDPELRYRTDSVCYHSRIGYFTVSETWIDLLDLWDCKSRNMTEVACSATTLVIANRLIELKLARDTGKPIDTKRKRPLPYLGDGIVAPLDAEIYPTYRCNHKCTFCSSGDRVFGTDDKQDLRREFIDEIAERLNKVGLFNVGIVGGEPFLYPHLEQLIDALIAKGMHVYLTTNGSSSPDRIAAICGSGLHLAVSVHSDGPEENDSLTGRAGSFFESHTDDQFLGAKEHTCAHHYSYWPSVSTQRFSG